MVDIQARVCVCVGGMLARDGHVLSLATLIDIA